MNVDYILGSLFMIQSGNFRYYRQILIESRDKAFPIDSVVYVSCEGRFHGYGIVRDCDPSACDADHVAVEVESGNTWFYPVESITQYKIHREEWPSWIIRKKRRCAALKGVRTRQDNERRSQELERR